MAYGDPPPPNPGEVPPPGYGNVPQPNYGNPPPGNAPPPGYVPPPSYPNAPPPSYGSAPPPGYGNAPPPGYGNMPAPGYGSPQGYGNGPAVNYANWAQRVGAALIDAAPGIVLAIINSAVGSIALSLVITLISLGITIYNRWYLAGTIGQSWGKMVLHLKLISESTGGPIGPGMAFARDIVHILDALPCFIGYLFPLWDAKRQTFADKILNTIVVTI
jgi:uncharacterized RDD family membrane protein YckC